MNGGCLHCRADGTAVLTESNAPAAGDLAVIPYAEDLKLIVRAELPGKKKLYATVQVKDIVPGESRKLIDVAAAGEGARIVAYELATKLGKKSKAAARRERPSVDVSADDEGDGSTPAQLWASEIKNVPTPLPEGYVAFLPMKAEFYEDIECGVKRAEYRSDTAKYKAMFGMKKPVAVRLQYGYTKRQMAWQVVKVNYEPGEGYEICLGKRLF